MPIANVFFAPLTFLILLQLLPISSFRPLFLLKALFGSSWSNPWSVVLILSTFQLFWAMLLMFGKRLLNFCFVVLYDFWELLIDRFFVVTLICESLLKFFQVVFSLLFLNKLSYFFRVGYKEYWSSKI